MTEAEGEVIVNRFGDKTVSPWYDVRSRALKQATQMGQLFGVTPRARGKIETGKSAPASKLELLQKSKIAWKRKLKQQGQLKSRSISA